MSPRHSLKVDALEVGCSTGGVSGKDGSQGHGTARQVHTKLAGSMMRRKGDIALQGGMWYIATWLISSHTRSG